MKGRFLLDVVVAQGATVFQLLTSKDKTLLIGGNTLLVLNLALHVVDGVARFNLESDGLSSESLHKDLHTTAKTEDQVQCGFLLDVVVGKSSSVLELLAGEDKSLLIRGNTLLILDLALHVVDGVGRLDFQSNSLSGEGLDEDLHTTTKAEDEMKGGLLLDVVVGECSAILKLLSSKDQALLVRRNTFLVLDLRLDIVDGIGGFDLKSDGLASEGLDD